MAKKFLTPIQSTVSTGTAPFIVASTTAVTNLNADLLDGQQGSYYASASSLSNYQPIDADLTAIAALSGTSGLLKKTAANTWALDTNTYLTGNQTITLTGDVSGSGTTSISVIVADDSHNHIISNVDGLQTALDAKAPLASPNLTGTPTAPTAAIGTNTTQIATTAFVNSEIANDAIGKTGLQIITQAAGSTINTAGQVNTLQIKQDTAGSDAFITFHVSGDYAAHFGIDGTTNDLSYGGWSAGAVKYRVWHAGNDGSGSGLDADLLDGQDGSYYAPISSPTFTGQVTTNSHVVAGEGSGAVSLSINDGYGNANVAWNHHQGKPDVNGNAARIEVNVDSTSGANMNFELKSNVTAETAVTLTSILNLSESVINAYVPIAGQTPSSSSHLTTKAYVDSVAGGGGLDPFFLGGM